MAVEAIRQISDYKKHIKGYMLKEISFLKAVQVPEGPSGLETSFVFHLNNNDNIYAWYNFQLFTFQNNSWVLNCKDQIGAEYDDIQDQRGVSLSSKKPTSIEQYSLGKQTTCIATTETEKYYEKLATFGLEFGPSFRTLDTISYNNDGESIAFINNQAWKQNITRTAISKHVIHPTALDGVLQVILVALSKGGTEPIPTLVPTQIEEMWLSNDLLDKQPYNDRMQLFSKCKANGLREIESNITAFDLISGQTRVRITGMQVVAIANPATSTADPNVPARFCFSLYSQPDLDMMTRREIIE